MALPINRVNPKQLGELLVEKNIITQSELIKALELQKEKGGLIGDVLVGLGLVKEEDIARVLTAQYGFPYLPLSNYEVDIEVVKIVPYNVARQYCLVPIDKMGSTLTVAMANPLNLQAIEDIEFLSGCAVQVFVSTASDIKNIIEKSYKR